MSALKLEVGKFYKTKFNTVIKIELWTRNKAEYKYRSSEGFYYTSEGKELSSKEITLLYECDRVGNKISPPFLLEDGEYYLVSRSSATCVHRRTTATISHPQSLTQYPFIGENGKLYTEKGICEPSSDYDSDIYRIVSKAGEEHKLDISIYTTFNVPKELKTIVVNIEGRDDSFEIIVNQNGKNFPVFVHMNTQK